MLAGGYGADTLRGGSGNDTITGYESEWRLDDKDYRFAGWELHDDGAVDRIFGDDGNDLIFVGARDGRVANAVEIPLRRAPGI